MYCTSQLLPRPTVEKLSKGKKKEDDFEVRLKIDKYISINNWPIDHADCKAIARVIDCHLN